MNSASERIEAARARFGKRLVILGHHYENAAVIRHTDIQGDSLELARRIEGLAAEHVVFCGVSFMAESAAALARPGQKIYISHRGATCPMAEMAPAGRLEEVLAALRAGGRNVVPLAYVNSTAGVKAVCGRFGGSVCTSANARVMLKWALGQGDAVLFLPDRHLGENTANELGIPEDERLLIRLRRGSGFVDPDRAARTRLFLWPGACPIHHRLKKEDVEAVRRALPGVKVVVHPECRSDVVRAADGAGSTSYLIRYCAAAGAGAKIAVGTEVNLVRRLAGRHQAEGKTIVPLRPLECINMAKTTEDGLADLLDNLENAAPVTLPEEIAGQARVALKRMLNACA